jgi:phage/conjugal plasmid C-4 type zinc finger TraR family protein
MVDKPTRELLAERKQTLAELQRLRSYMEVGEDRIIDTGEDSVDAAADVYEREKTLAIIQTLEKKLAAIDRALRAAEKGSYGICEVCGQPISAARLEVMPHSTTCIQCQQKLERMPGRRPLFTPPREEE